MRKWSLILKSTTSGCNVIGIKKKLFVIITQLISFVSLPLNNIPLLFFLYNSTFYSPKYYYYQRPIGDPSETYRRPIKDQYA